MRRRLRPGLSGELEHAVVELVVHALLVQQLLVVAPLDDAAVIQHHDGVGVADRAEAVGDDKHRAALHEPVHALLDEALCPCVDAAGGLVQDQHRRVGHSGPGDGKELALPLREALPVPGDHGAVAVREPADEGVGAGQAGGIFHILVRGVQLPEADIVGNGAGKEMGVLEHNGHGASQGVFFYISYVDAVVGDGASADVVKAADQVDDGGLPGAGGAHEGNLLARLGVEADLVQYLFVLPVPEGHIVKADVPAKGREGVGAGVLPGPFSCPLRAFFQVSLTIHRDVCKDYVACVLLRRLVHHVEYPLCAGQCGQHEVRLLGELVYRQGGLSHKDEIACQGADVDAAPDGHQAAQDSHHRVVDVGDADHHGDHGAGVGGGLCPRLPQESVFLVEGPQAVRLVVEDLDHLLAPDHLLDVAVQLAQVLLLVIEIVGALFPAVADVEEHGGVPKNDQETELPVQDEEDGQRPHNLDKTLDDHGKAVVEGIGDGVHVVGEAAHGVPVRVGVKVPERQLFHGVEEVPADVIDDLLGGFYHGLAVAEGRGRPGQVDGGGDRHAEDEPLQVPRHDILVDDGLYHVGAKQVGSRADGDKKGHRRQQEFMHAHVGEELPKCAPQVFGALSVRCCHGLSASFL